MISHFELFPTVAFYAYFTAVLRLIFHLIFHDISLKNQETFVYFFRHVSFNIQWILFVLTFFVELSF